MVPDERWQRRLHASWATEQAAGSPEGGMKEEQAPSVLQEE